jgi:hypothetical protein
MLAGCVLSKTELIKKRKLGTSGKPGMPLNKGDG